MLLQPVLVLGFATFVATQDNGGFMSTCQWRGAVYDDERGTISMYCNNDNWAIYDYDWTVSVPFRYRLDYWVLCDTC